MREWYKELEGRVLDTAWEELTSGNLDVKLSSDEEQRSLALAAWNEMAERGLHPDISPDVRPPTFELLVKQTKKKLIEALLAEDHEKNRT